ncbi:YadA family autotransporter adhesin, partial [Inquilinus limosus]|uniref:YadA family autotransporter adhesin n=1 Tax=Inquilinus limosus TaxID=171674 RepID=UPI003D2F0F69
MTGTRNVALGSGDGTVDYDATSKASAGNLVTGDDNVAIGTNAGIGVAASKTTSIGYNANASAENAIAMGTQSVADAADAVAIGTGAKATGGKAVSIGAGNVATGDGAVAIGDPNSVTGTGAVGMGANNTVNGTGAVALGSGNTATGQGSVALGNTSSAAGAGSLAFGDAASATNAGDVALGSGSVTTKAVGTAGTTIRGTAYTFAGATPTSTVSVGAPGAERTITNVAAGRIALDSTDAINGSQLFASNQAIENLVTSSATHYYSVNDGGTKGGNYDNDGATGANAMAAGIGASASGAQDVAQGFGANASGGDAVALGTNTKAAASSSIAIGANAAASGASGSTAVGANSSASASNSLAVGEFANASGELSAAVGPGATASAEKATALGNGSKALAASSVALGDGASANNAGDVALGSGSVTAAAVGTASTTIAGKTYAFAGTTPNSTVSVGAAGAERTITNVAAGRIALDSTDAVNGSQLFATNTAVDTLNTQITDVTGKLTHYYSVNDGGTKGANYDNDGAAGVNSLAAGVAASTSVDDGVAIGHGATAGANAGDVALGSGSTTAAAVQTKSTTIAGNTYNFAGTNPTSTVSVGAAGAERTITNVAAGRIAADSTDAVNGSQLFATNTSVDTLNTKVDNITTGGGIKYFHANSTLADSQATGT